MPKHKDPSAGSVEFELTLPDEFAGMPDDEVAKAQHGIMERADRVRRRISMNQVYIRPLPSRSRKDRKG